MTPDLIATIHSVVELLLTALFLGVGVWALKAYIVHRTKLPRAREGFFTLEDLSAHCATIQKGCLSGLTQKMESFASVVDRRLAIGDKAFEEHTTRLRAIEVDLAAATTELMNFEKGFCDRVVNVLRKLKNEENNL